MEHRLAILENGLRIAHTEMPQMHSATIAVFVGVGSRHEPDPSGGVSHLIEHMLFKGTERRPNATDISQAIDAVGGVLNASTEKELTVYWAKVAQEHVPLAFDLLADMLRFSKLSPRELAKEKHVVVDELNMLVDDPQDWVHVLADETMWPRQPIGREIAGTQASVAALRRHDLQHYLATYYGPNNAVLSFAGSDRAAKTIELAHRCFGEWTAVQPAAPVPAFIPTAAPRCRIEHRPNAQLNVCLGFPGIGRRDPDRWAVDVLCSILGGSASSRLFVQLRERLGLAYDVQAYPIHFSDTGSVVIAAGVDAAKANTLLDALFREIERLQRRRATEAELQRAKDYFRGRLWLGLEDTHAVASWYGAQIVLDDDVSTPEQVVAQIDAVSVEDIREVARRYLRDDLARLVAVGPAQNLALESRVLGA